MVRWKLNSHTCIRLVLILMAAVALVYGVYIMQKPGFLYDALMGIRFLLLFMTIVGLYLIKAKVDRYSALPVGFAIYSICRAGLSGGNLLNQALTLLTWPCIYFLFYTYTKKMIAQNYFQRINIKKLQHIVVGTILLMTVCSVPLIQMHLSGNGRAGEVIFPIYFFLTMLSMVLLLFPHKKKIWILPCLMIVLTTKRSGLLVLAIGLLLAEFSEYYLEGTVKKKGRRLINIIAIIIVAVIGFLVIVQIFHLDILERLASLSEDGGSGRVEIWAAILSSYGSGNIFQQIFGRGFQSVTRLMLTGRAILAHNDYLELIHDYGILGLALCVGWIIQILRLYFKARRYKFHVLPSFSYTVCSLLILSFTSYLLIQSYLMNYTACYLGIVVALVSKNVKDVRFLETSGT